MRVYVGSTNPVKAEAVQRVFARAFPDPRAGPSRERRGSQIGYPSVASVG